MIPLDLVVDVLAELQSRSLSYIVDGGWGIDALVGRVTREHDDLDLAVDIRDIDTILVVLQALGFTQDEGASPGPPVRIVLKDELGNQVDLHPLAFDDRGNGWQALGAGAWAGYPADGLAASGVIRELTVRCLSPELQLRHHLGYVWDKNDSHDMRLLHEHFEIPLPPLDQ